jgi:hypothetical protein
MIAGMPSKLADSSVSANSLRHLGDLAEADLGAGRSGDDRDVGEAALVLAALVGADEDLAGRRLHAASGHLQRGLRRPSARSRRASGPWIRSCSRGTSIEISRAGAPARSTWVIRGSVEELVARLLGEVAQHPEVLLPVHDHRQHLRAVGQQADDRALGLLGQAR